MKVASIALLAALLMACGSQEPELAPELMSILAEADKIDGNEDKLVSKCASCALMMDGKEELAHTVAGYKMHFCSEICQKSYANDAAGRLATLKIPEALMDSDAPMGDAPMGDTTGEPAATEEKTEQ